MIKTISLDLETVTGGIARGPAIATWGQDRPGVRAELYRDGTLRFFGPKTEIVELGGHPQGITRRGEFTLTPKEPYRH